MNIDGSFTCRKKWLTTPEIENIIRENDSQWVFPELAEDAEFRDVIKQLRVGFRNKEIQSLLEKLPLEKRILFE
jgi:hypothetical protein